MKIFLGQIVNSKEALVRLSQEKLPIKISYRIQKNIEAIQSELNHFEKQRNKLIIDKYGVEEKDKDGNGTGNWKVPPESNLLFTGEMNDLMSEELDLQISQVSLPDDCKISAIDISLLSWMIKFEEVEN